MASRSPFERKAQIFTDAGESGFQGGTFLCGHSLGELSAQGGLGGLPGGHGRSRGRKEEAGGGRSCGLPGQ